MAEYLPTPIKWVREQVELYESSGGTQGTELLETGLPCIVVTHKGNKTGAIRKTPLMRVKDGDRYVLVASQGGGAEEPGVGLQPARRRRRCDPGQDRGAPHAGAGSRRPERAGAGMGAGGGRLPALRGVQEQDRPHHSVFVAEPV